MPKWVLPVIAVVMVGLAAGGVTLGVRAVAEKEGAEAAGAAADAAAPGLSAPELSTPPERQAEAEEHSFVRFGAVEAPAKREGTIRLATYNVENLFDAIDDPGLSGRNEDIDDAKPEARLRGVAETIRRLDADVLALEEIESEQVIAWFRDSYLSGMGYAYLASVDAGDERGIEQSVLSRFPITSATNWPGRELGGTHPEKWGDAENYEAGRPIRFHRSPLRVEIEVPAETAGGGEPYALTLYVVHAKSGAPGEYWRRAEAAGLVQLLTDDLATHPAENVAVLGDFNAILSDGSVQTIVGAGFSDALGDVYERGPRFVTHESGRRIDHILVNANLAAELVAGSGFVLGTPALPEGMDWREEWRPEGYASDHYPVAVDIEPREGASGG